MEKNDFLKYNDFLYLLYSEPDLSSVMKSFLKRFKDFVSYEYSSFLLIQNENGSVHLSSPICEPESFIAIENEYINYETLDNTNWPLYSNELTIIRESEIISDDERLNSAIYQNLYLQNDIFDTLQMSIPYNNMPYAALTLYKTRSQGRFTSEDVFYMRAVSRHLCNIFASHLSSESESVSSSTDSSGLYDIIEKYHLTNREAEILSYIFEGYSNDDIQSKISVSIHTLQKHLQNIYRKIKVSSRWELLKFKR